MNLNIFDMDGTIIDSTAALRVCQIEGLVKATGKDYSVLESELQKSSLNNVLQNYQIDTDTFFKIHYKTFDPFEAAKNGTVGVFPDAWIFSQDELSNKRLNTIVSNSGVSTTLNKLSAVNCKDLFQYVFAEFEKGKAKPTPYMANQLVDVLKENNQLNDLHEISNFGDMPVDMEFGKVAHEVLSTATGRNLPLKSYLLDRQGKYEPNQPGIIVVQSFYDIKNHEGT